MHPAEIQCALKKRGITQKALAHELSVSETMVYSVIRGIATSYRTASRIAEITGLDIEEMWPGRYSAERRAA